MVNFDEKKTNQQIVDLLSHEEEQLIAQRAAQLGYQYINLNEYTINPEALILIQEERSRQAGVVAFELNRNRLMVATRTPGDPATQTLFKELMDQKFAIDVYLCSHSSLDHAWERYQDITNTTKEKKGVFEIDTEVISRLSQRIKGVEDIKEILQEVNAVSNVRRISETLELAFAGALAMRASDIHIEPERETVRLRYRFDGVLHNILDIDTYVFNRIMSRLKLLSGMVINTRAIAQDGRFTFDIGEKRIEVRASVIPGAIGESIVMRLLDPTTSSFQFDNINLNSYIKQAVEKELKKPNGLIITTGPTGSGKTTALYSFLQKTHHEGVKIITIENPVEYKLNGIVQTQTDEDYTFANGLRAILRQDPDIILVGEIRDREVAETAIHAAQTGHLVFSTLHTNSAVAAFARLIDLGVDPRVMGTSINMIMGQRLVRVLCLHCKQSYQASPEEKRLIQHVMQTHPYPIEVPEPTTLFRAVGCTKCGNTGFFGREGIFEGILMDEAVEAIVLRDPREHLIHEAAKPQKIPTMLEDGIEKVIQGITSLTELERVIEIPYIAEDGKTLAVPSIDTLESDTIDISKHIV